MTCWTGRVAGEAVAAPAAAGVLTEVLTEGIGDGIWYCESGRAEGAGRGVGVHGGVRVCGCVAVVRGCRQRRVGWSTCGC